MQFFAPLLCFFLAIAMADAREQRREYAQVLRRFAASLGVARCRDNASREQVKEMADAVMAAGALSGPRPRDFRRAMCAPGEVEKRPLGRRPGLKF